MIFHIEIVLEIYYKKKKSSKNLYKFKSTLYQRIIKYMWVICFESGISTISNIYYVK